MLGRRRSGSEASANGRGSRTTQEASHEICEVSRHCAIGSRSPRRANACWWRAFRILSWPNLALKQRNKSPVTLAMHLAMIVEDDRAMQDVLRILFEVGGFRVVVCDTVRHAENDARLYRPDVVVVDLALPDGDGKAVIQSIRSWSPMPIIVVSARVEEGERVAALDRGADDFIVKPFSAPELMARVRAVLRRHVRGELPMGQLRLANVSIDLNSRTAQRRDGTRVRLTPIEHRIVETLARYRDAIVTHESLLNEVWGPHCDDLRGLRVYIGNLRRKLEEDPSRPKYFVTETGVGYRLVQDSGVNSELEAGLK
jgi:two-component system, OmpR family, KDP operon response regulator KdpE